MTAFKIRLGDRVETAVYVDGERRMTEEIMTTFSPNRVEKLKVSLTIKLADGQGEQAHEMIFRATDNGRESSLNQLADLLLSACDLARSYAVAAAPAAMRDLTPSDLMSRPAMKD